MSRAVITQRTDTLTHPRLGWHLLWMLHMAFFLCLLSANACASKEKIEGSRMETDGEWRYGYDKDGNLVERYKGSGNGGMPSVSTGSTHGTISLSQMSKAELIQALPWQEIAFLRTKTEVLQVCSVPTDTGIGWSSLMMPLAGD